MAFERGSAGRAGCVLLAAAAAGPALALDFNPGQWHVTAVTEIRGLNVRPPPPYYYDRCYTGKDILANLSPPASPCRAMPTRSSETEIAWKLMCDASVGNFSGSGLVKFSGNTIEGIVVTHSTYPQPMEVTQRISGKRVGVCKSKPPAANLQPIPGAGAGGAPRGDRLPDYRP